MKHLDNAPPPPDSHQHQTHNMVAVLLRECQFWLIYRQLTITQTIIGDRGETREKYSVATKMIYHRPKQSHTWYVHHNMDSCIAGLTITILVSANTPHTTLKKIRNEIVQGEKMVETCQISKRIEQVHS